jgi:hypothetical protein
MDALTLLSYSLSLLPSVYGPIAAFSCEMFPVKEDTHQCLTVPMWWWNFLRITAISTHFVTTAKGTGPTPLNLNFI